MTPSTPSLQGERGSEEKLSLLLLVPMPCIAVDDACYVWFLCSAICLIFCRAHRASVFCLIYCRAHRASVFCLICCRAHRVSVFCYVPYFLGFALVFLLRTLL
ncbi:hypothetical protein ACE6H2_018328 [Prunus campanulata]